MFFQFNQNNSGGRFVRDDEVDNYVVIEAANSDEANILAQCHGIYFDGCAAGRDCSCCGNRWGRTYDEGQEAPTLYGEPVENARYDGGCYVYYLDGRKEHYGHPVRN